MEIVYWPSVPARAIKDQHAARNNRLCPVCGYQFPSESTFLLHYVLPSWDWRAEFEREDKPETQETRLPKH